LSRYPGGGPSGRGLGVPLTFMFTDVVGSTRLHLMHGDEAAQQALQAHERTIRERVIAREGEEVKTLGDGFLLAFRSPRQALQCGLEIQEELADLRRSERLPLSVKIGIHAGEAVERDGDVFGQAVSATARIAERAEGDQIVVSQVVKQLAGSVPGIRYTPLGEAQLRGFEESWHLFSVEADEADTKPTLIPRSHLDQHLEQALRRRLITVTAGAGFGKTSLLRSWSDRVNATWHTVPSGGATLDSVAQGVVEAVRLRVPSLPADLHLALDPAGGDAATDASARSAAVATVLCDVLERTLTRDLVLVIDDAHELEGEGPLRFVETLCRQAPPLLHLVLSGRTEVPFPIDRLRGQGEVLEITGRELTFTEDEVLALVRRSLGDEEAAGEIHGLTGGWPAGVRLTIEALRRAPAQDREATLDGIAGRGGSLFTYLANEVFERESDEVKELVRTAAGLERFSPPLLESLGHSAAEDTVASLERRGMFIEPVEGAPGWFSLSPLLRDFAEHHLGLEENERVKQQEAAAKWLEDRGEVAEALRALVSVDAEQDVVRLLHERGRQLIATGNVDGVLRAIASLSVKLDERLEELSGEALQMRGEWDRALECFERAGTSKEHVRSSVAWRAGLIHYLRGDIDEALAIYERGEAAGEELHEDALLLAWKATAYWAQGDDDSCRATAGLAFETAKRSGDHRALAAAHTVLALEAAMNGDRTANDAHYIKALEHAERAGDVLQIIRIHTNRGSHHYEEGFYEESIEELDIAIRLAEVGGFASFHALALSNRADSKSSLGMLDEARSDLEAARRLYASVGSKTISAPLTMLGNLYAERGDRTLARAHLEEALKHADETSDIQSIVPTVLGLARVLMDEDLDEAQRLVDRALEFETSLDRTDALICAGQIALRRADLVKAAEFADIAGTLARSRRDRAALARALELKARTGSVDEPARLLDEAESIWAEIRNPLGKMKVGLARAELASGEERLKLASVVAAEARSLGARGVAAEAERLTQKSKEQRPSIRIQTLGGFSLQRGDATVPATEWPSKKARDLLKMLVARRGRSIPRDLLMETLWPDEEPDKLSNRLSVALSTVRTTLDPGKRFPANAFLTADKNVVSLSLEKLSVDVEEFLAAVERGMRLIAEGENEEGRECLTRAEALYKGDFLEEDLYEDWTTALREEARSAYVRITRVLGEAAVSSGDHDAATRYLLRILERDPYDEDAHLGLVENLIRAGRHGEARRHYRTYCGRMEQIEIESAPFPASSGSHRGRRLVAL
jgi:ATP/maltotriose-dependent transcriptional regulator MalT/class 3 adenylate cyclase